MGGMVAQTMLRRWPDAYAAVVLACTSPAFGNADGDFQRKFVADRLDPLDAGKTMADLAPTLVRALMGPNPNGAGRAHAGDVMARVPADTYRAAIRCLVTFDERANLAHIRVPVLCLASEKDPAAPALVMERMAARIPGARYVCLPGLGHLPKGNQRSVHGPCWQRDNPVVGWRISNPRSLAVAAMHSGNSRWQPEHPDTSSPSLVGQG